MYWNGHICLSKSYKPGDLESGHQQSCLLVRLTRFTCTSCRCQIPLYSWCYRLYDTIPTIPHSIVANHKVTALSGYIIHSCTNVIYTNVYEIADVCITDIIVMLTISHSAPPFDQCGVMPNQNKYSWLYVGYGIYAPLTMIMTLLYLTIILQVNNVIYSL